MPPGVLGYFEFFLDDLRMDNNCRMAKMLAITFPMNVKRSFLLDTLLIEAEFIKMFLLSH
jgi:hypothetical protein